MKRPLLLTLAVIYAALTPAHAGDRLVDGFPDLPKDARYVAERSVACAHFWGEANGTGDERDRQISEQLRKLSCDRIERDLDEVRLKYKDDRRVLEILAEASG